MLGDDGEDALHLAIAAGMAAVTTYDFTAVLQRADVLTTGEDATDLRLDIVFELGTHREAGLTNWGSWFHDYFGMN